MSVSILVEGTLKDEFTTAFPELCAEAFVVTRSFDGCENISLTLNVENVTINNVNNGEIISLVSLPDFDPNKREKIDDVNYINRATKGIYEFGSVFKTFTLAAAFNENLIEPKTEFTDLPKSL